MAKTRIKVEQFDGTGDFTLWKIRMLAYFGTQGLKDVVLNDDFKLGQKESKDDDKASDSKKEEKTESDSGALDSKKLEDDEKAKNLIILNVGDHVLRKIKMCETAAVMWATLDRLYLSKSLPNRIFVQSQFYTFKSDFSKTIDVNVDEFLKIVAEMSSLNVVVSEEIQAILFLSFLPHNYDQLKHTLKYGRETLTLEEVISATKYKI